MRGHSRTGDKPHPQACSRPGIKRLFIRGSRGGPRDQRAQLGCPVITTGPPAASPSRRRLAAARETAVQQLQPRCLQLSLRPVGRKGGRNLSQPASSCIFDFTTIEISVIYSESVAVWVNKGQFILRIAALVMLPSPLH